MDLGKPLGFKKRQLPILFLWACCYLLKLAACQGFRNRVLVPGVGVRDRVLTAFMLAGMRLTSKEGLALLLHDDAACELFRLQASQFVAAWSIRGKAAHERKI